MFFGNVHSILCVTGVYIIVPFLYWMIYHVVIQLELGKSHPILSVGDVRFRSYNPLIITAVYRYCWVKQPITVCVRVDAYLYLYVVCRFSLGRHHQPLLWHSIPFIPISFDVLSLSLCIHFLWSAFISKSPSLLFAVSKSFYPKSARSSRDATMPVVDVSIAILLNVI